MGQAIQAKLAAALKSPAGRKQKGLIPERVFASSSRDLEALVDNDDFHSGLHEILKENTVTVPPLRENRALIPTLVYEYFEDLEEKGNVVSNQINEDAMRE